MISTQNLCEARLNDLRRYLLFLRLLKSSSERNSSSKEASILFCISLLVFFNVPYLNFGLIWTCSSCSFFLQWKQHLFKISTWNKKSDPNIIPSYFESAQYGNQTFRNFISVQFKFQPYTKVEIPGGVLTTSCSINALTMHKKT